MKEKLQPLIFGLKLGIVLFPCFFILDYFVYPHHKYTLLMIRMGVTLYLLVLLLAIDRIKERYYNRIILLTIFIAALSISSMCLATGEGFASPYYGGVLQVIIITALLFKIRPLHYVLIMVSVVAQHFILLSLLPWNLPDLLINILAIGIFAVVAVVIHNFIYAVVRENESLKGMLPICSQCKKIRDDTGYWNQMESYIEKHSGAAFSHSLCPECSDALYGEKEWYIKMKKKRKKSPVSRP